MADNVTAFPGIELPENPMQLVPRPPGYCDHSAIVIDEHNRVVTCADSKCGATLDPFNFLCSNATTLQRAWSNYAYVTRQVAEVTERVHALKKEEQRMRGMVKRLQEKAGSVINVRNPKD